MTIPTEQQVLTAMGISGIADAVEPVADLLIALGYPDVAKELRVRCDVIGEYYDE